MAFHDGVFRGKPVVSDYLGECLRGLFTEITLFQWFEEKGWGRLGVRRIAMDLYYMILAIEPRE